jgi:hypothetical protein
LKLKTTIEIFYSDGEAGRVLLRTVEGKILLQRVPNLVSEKEQQKWPHLGMFDKRRWRNDLSG